MTTSDFHPLRAADLASGVPLPRKTFDCEFKSLDDAGTFVLYAACFGNLDRQGDVIEQGAFTNLDEFAKDGWVALNHAQGDLPVAMVDTAIQDSKGLRITGTFHSTGEAQAVRTVVKERMAAGKAVKCSLGYLTEDESFEKSDGKTVRHIKKLSVYEASFVNLPANPLAEVTAVKSGGAMPDPPIEQKRSVAISAANRKMLEAHVDAMAEHHSKCMQTYKAIGKMHKDMGDSLDEMKAFVSSFAPPEPESDEEEANEGEEERTVEMRKKPKKKPEKSAEPADDSNQPGPLEQTANIYRSMLRNRQSAGRKIQPCP